MDNCQRSLEMSKTSVDLNVEVLRQLPPPNTRIGQSKGLLQ